MGPRAARRPAQANAWHAIRSPIDGALRSAYSHPHQAGGAVKKRHVQQAISEDEQIGRYAYVLGTVPANVADKAYAAAFARLSSPQRQEILGQLRSEFPVAPQVPASDDPEAFAVFMRDLRSRDALVRVSGVRTFAAEFVASPPVVAYFTAGVGSVTI